MKILRFILGDQLTPGLSALEGAGPGDIILMAEVRSEATYVRHHKQKIAFLFSAMRHHAAALREAGLSVDYVELTDPENTQTLGGELARAVARHRPDRIVMTEPGEWRVLALMQDWRETLGLPFEIRDDSRFLCPLETFRGWAEGRRELRMEYFYRMMRRRTGYLMEGEEPVGGQWNFDAENRKRLAPGVRPPAPPPSAQDTITKGVVTLVGREFSGHFGSLDTFFWPVTRAAAREALERFVTEGLPHFGDYQDAMAQGEPFLFHSLLSPCLNAGLLTAREVCDAAQAAYDEGHVPLNAAEGFIRQIIGWREYVRGIYWLKGETYARSNALGAKRSLPRFYWTGDTDMACLHAAIGQTRDHAYAHHIQRLMVTGNFALVAGLDPASVEEWYLIVYADAYEWVELPNVHGMVLFADGGVLGSKPYAASGAYIDRMSDYCKGCRYDVKARSGAKACPFNYLYWDFLMRNASRLSRNPRMAMPYRNLARFDEARRAQISADAARFLDALEPAKAGDY